MDSQALRDATGNKSKRPSVVNLAVRIADIELNEDKPSFFVGARLDTGETVRVRLMTIDEAVEANTNKNSNDGDRERMKNYFTEKFATGTYVRPSAAKFADPRAKEHVQPGGVMLFEKAIQNDDGTFRAQWPNTMAPSPSDGAMKVVLHLDATEENPATKRKAQVRATILMPDAAVAIGANDQGKAALKAMMTPKDSQGQPRQPVPVLRVALADGKLAHALVPPMATKTKKLDPNTGLEKEISVNMEPDAAINAILSNPDGAKTTNGKLTKAVLSGLTGIEANYGDTPAAAVATLKQLSANIASGTTPVQAIPGQRIYAGNQAAIKMIKDAGRQGSPMNKLLNSGITEEIKVRGEAAKITIPTYTEAFVGVMRHQDSKAPYLRDVFPTTPWPKFAKLDEVELGPNAKLNTKEQVEPEFSDDGLGMGMDDDMLDQGLAAAAADTSYDGPSM